MAPLFFIGPAELRMFAQTHAKIFLSYTFHHPPNYHMLTQSSGSIPSTTLEERFEKAKSSDVAQASPTAPQYNYLTFLERTGMENTTIKRKW